ncbi:hypothetical protein PAXRUDRAFT_21687 [Paxillus rubicundulus Ve08.2h10]|uniref:Uncharacterized protein n=1 Tax=Paxillus rubicundulus Ve08.2h10 TaxID=930991 RepID=A0A0D0CAT9_9AGAM|nr:hypothetical protein PAXRUDRAFT_21687 [Paxillus rubicundulus Ve08.2h10]
MVIAEVIFKDDGDWVETFKDHPAKFSKAIQDQLGILKKSYCKQVVKFMQTGNGVMLDAEGHVNLLCVPPPPSGPPSASPPSAPPSVPEPPQVICPPIEPPSSTVGQDKGKQRADEPPWPWDDVNIDIDVDVDVDMDMGGKEDLYKDDVDVDTNRY